MEKANNVFNPETKTGDINLNEVNSGEAISKAVIGHFDRLAANYDRKSEKREAYLRAVDELIIAQIKQDDVLNPVLLDVGTGTGTRAENLKARIPGSTLFGCDISPEMVAIAKTKKIDDVRVADMSKLPYADESFNDAFALFAVFCYAPTTEKREEALREFFRVLKPGGVLMMDVLNRWHTGEGLEYKKSKSQITEELEKSLANDPSLEWGDVRFLPDAQFLQKEQHSQIPGFFHTFSEKEARKLFTQAGFVVEKFNIVGYNTGKIHTDSSKGNFLFTLRKPLFERYSSKKVPTSSQTVSSLI